MKIKKFSLLTLGFILAIQVGALLSEWARIQWAKNNEYKYDYYSVFGRFVFVSEGELSNSFESLLNKCNGDYKSYKASKEFKLLFKIDCKNQFKIDLAGKLCVWIISVLGLVLFF